MFDAAWALPTPMLDPWVALTALPRATPVIDIHRIGRIDWPCF